MKNINNKTDDLLRAAIVQDDPGIVPDRSIEQRLNYYYTLKQPAGKVQANSFMAMFVWLFSLKSIGLKAGLVSVCLVYALFIGNMKSNSGAGNLADTSMVHQLLVDTNYVVKDTCK